MAKEGPGGTRRPQENWEGPGGERSSQEPSECSQEAHKGPLSPSKPGWFRLGPSCASSSGAKAFGALLVFSDVLWRPLAPNVTLSSPFDVVSCLLGSSRIFSCPL